MRIPPVIAAAVAGAVLATGGLAAVNLATESAGATQDADAQSGSQFATKAEVQAANTRASAAINMGKRVWNLYGIYGAEPGELIGANSGPIKQLRGVGGGIPGSALSQETQSKINGGGSGGPQGPAGGQGPSGPAGPQGPPGPTSGDAVATDPPDPLPAAQVTLPPAVVPQQPTVTTTVPGRLHVTANFSGFANCSSASFAWHWITVDGVPVKSSFRLVPEATTPQAFSATGITDAPVAAGEHTILGKLACFSGASSGSGSVGQASVSAIVLG